MSRPNDLLGDVGASANLPARQAHVVITDPGCRDTADDAPRAVPTMEVAMGFSSLDIRLGFDGPFDLLGGHGLGADGIAFDLAMDWHPALMRHVEAACGDQRVQGRDWFRMPPTLLAGQDGVGRTHISRRIARSAGLPHVVFDLADPRIGRREAPPEVPELVPPLVAMAITRCANPIVSVVNADTSSPVALALITRLVDQRANRRIVATALGAQLDLGQVSWLVQSSAPDRLPERLTDLLVRVDLEDPDGEDTDFVAIDLMAEVVADLGLPPPHAGTVESVLARYRNRRGYPSAHVRVGEMYAQIAALLQGR